MNNLVPFSFEDKSIRVVSDEQGDPLFVAKDVAEALGYVRFDTNLIGHIPPEWKGSASISTPGGTQNMAVLTKQGVLYFLSRSDKPKAHRLLTQWFTSDLDVSALVRALNEFEVPDDLPDLYVYAIREKVSGNIKLGISRDPQRRLRELQTGNSSELELVAYRKAENRFDDERALHYNASAFHVRGEWFESQARSLIN